MAIGRKLGGIATLKQDSGMLGAPKAMADSIKSTVTNKLANAGLPTAMPPAGLPPAEYAMAKLGVKPKLPTAGPLINAKAPRRITPAVPNQGRMDQLLGKTQEAGQLSPDAVMGIDNQRWQQLLNEFGVFS